MLDALAALSRALLYAGVLTCAGVVFAAATLHVPAELNANMTRTLRRGALLTIVAAFAGALVLIFRLGGTFDEATLSAVFVSGSGAAIGLQVAGAALLLAAAGDPTPSHGTKITNAVLATLSFAFSGHAGAMSVTDGLIASLHVSAAAWWVGSLWCLWLGCAQLSFEQLIQSLRRFGVLATGLVGGLVIAGLVLVLVLVKFEQLPEFSSYEQLLLLKIALAASAIAIAAYNRTRLTPRIMSGDRAAVAMLRRTVTVELIVIAGVIATTAILTTYTSPHE